MKKISYLYIITIAYFILGFVHIGFSLLMPICLVLPFLLLARDKKKTWCQKICPRADYLKKLKPFSLKRKMPSWVATGKTRRLVLMYFCINMMFAVTTSLSVGTGNMEPMAYVRFMIVLPIGPLPQLLDQVVLSPALLNLSYRFYSLMLSSTVVATVMALYFKPRSWCAVCPVSTLSGLALNELKKEKQNG